MDSNIPVKPALGVYTSQLIRYAKICTKFEDFQERNLLITKNCYAKVTHTVIWLQHSKNFT